MLTELKYKVESGDRKALARAISLLEKDKEMEVELWTQLKQHQTP